MSIFQRFRDRLPQDKTEEELEKHYEEMDNLEKGDLPAMMIAAFLTFGPVALLIIGVFYGLLYLLVL